MPTLFLLFDPTPKSTSTETATISEKPLRKTFISMFCDFFMTFYLKNNVNVPSKSNKQ
jgi:hypothetical protein